MWGWGKVCPFVCDYGLIDRKKNERHFMRDKREDVNVQEEFLDDEKICYNRIRN